MLSLSFECIFVFKHLFIYYKNLIIFPLLDRGSTLKILAFWCEEMNYFISQNNSKYIIGHYSTTP